MEFTETYISDNRVKVLRDPTCDEIIIGGSSTNLFYLWFNFYEYIMRRDPNSESSLDYWYDCSIIYKQGFDVVLELKYGEYEIDVNSDNTTIISANLSPEQTLKFDDTVLDTYVQLKMKTVDGLTQYGRPVKLHVFKPLDCDSLV